MREDVAGAVISVEAREDIAPGMHFKGDDYVPSLRAGSCGDYSEGGSWFDEDGRTSALGLSVGAGEKDVFLIKIAFT